MQSQLKFHGYDCSHVQGSFIRTLATKFKPFLETFLHLAKFSLKALIIFLTLSRIEAGKLEEYQRQADQGNISAQMKLASYHYKKKEFSEAIKYLKLAARKGNPKAFYIIANMFEEGKGVPRNLGKAKKYYKLAIQNGSEKAKSRLSRLNKSHGNTAPSFDQSANTPALMPSGYQLIKSRIPTAPYPNSPYKSAGNWLPGLHVIKCSNGHTQIVEEGVPLSPEIEMCKSNQSHFYAIHDILNLAPDPMPKQSILYFCHSSGHRVLIPELKWPKEYPCNDDKVEADSSYARETTFLYEGEGPRIGTPIITWKEGKSAGLHASVAGRPKTASRNEGNNSAGVASGKSEPQQTTDREIPSETTDLSKQTKEFNERSAQAYELYKLGQIDAAEKVYTQLAKEGDTVSEFLLKVIKMQTTPADYKSDLEFPDFKIAEYFFFEKLEPFKAVKWYYMAALKGHELSQHTLAKIHSPEGSIKVYQNPLHAYVWARLSGKSGALYSKDLIPVVKPYLNQIELKLAEAYIKAGYYFYFESDFPVINGKEAKEQAEEYFQFVRKQLAQDQLQEGISMGFVATDKLLEEDQINLYQRKDNSDESLLYEVEESKELKLLEYPVASEPQNQSSANTPPTKRQLSTIPPSPIAQDYFETGLGYLKESSVKTDLAYDRKMAINFLEKAAHEGSGAAAFRLALHLNHEGYKVGIQEALLRGYELGNANCAFALGHLIFLDGLGDPKEAQEFFQKAFEWGHPKAKSYLDKVKGLL